LWLFTLLFIDVCLYSSWLLVLRNKFVSILVSMLLDFSEDGFIWFEFLSSDKEETKFDDTDEEDEGYVDEETWSGVFFVFKEVEV